jgi:putative glutamine amidotransferase
VNPHPLIGVTGPDRGGFPAWAFTWLAIRRAGGRAIRLRPGRFVGNRSLPELDGLILGGGADVDPQRYHRESDRMSSPADPPRSKGSSGRVLSWILAPFLLIARRIFSIGSHAVDRERDTFEDACLTTALEAGIPVLGICRGAQFINIHCGGSLHTDLAGFYGEAGNLGTVAPRKRIRLQPGSRLHAVLGDEAMVNSLHRQAVNRLGAGLAAIAHDDAGVVQAIEHSGHPFLSGVQWHPEYLPAMRDQQRIFQDLVTTARNRRDMARREVRVATNQTRRQPLQCAVEREAGSGNPDRR